MKITENTNDRLVIVNRPWIIPAFIVFMASLVIIPAALDIGDNGPWARAMAIGAGLLFLSVAHFQFPFTDTVFSRSENIVVHAERRLTGAILHPFALDDVLQAQLDSELGDRPQSAQTDTRSYRLTLQLADQRFPLEAGTATVNRREIETAINEWLSRPV